MKQFIRFLSVTLIILCSMFVFAIYLHYTKYVPAFNELELQLNLKQEENSLLLDYIDQIQNEVKSLKETIELQLKEIDDLRTIRARITAYSPLDNRDGIQAEGNPTVTATGKKVSRGIVAVNPRKIPYGTKLFIPGYGEAVAEDTGGAIRAYNGVALDILVDSYDEAMAWGVKYLDVKISK